MAKFKSFSVLTALIFVGLGAIMLFGVQQVMKATSSTEFCLSCHSMEQPKAEWEASSHFSNAKGIRAECADCHVPQDGLHYVKAKFIALKDLWYTITDKLPNQEAYEKHRLEMAQRVWKEMKETDSATCKSCHSIDAMELTEQSEAARKMHKLAQETNQTCIDCHKGLVHFMPEIEVDNAAAADELSKHGGEFSTNDKVLYALTMKSVQSVQGGEVRLMPYAELTDWKETNGKMTALLKGWQQVGAESVMYMDLGKRITVALLGDEVKDKVSIVKTVHDSVTDSEWREITMEIVVPKEAVTANISVLNQFGNNLNQTHCSGCHAVIGADHYTANQWIGVVNSMKDRTSMSADDVRTLTIFLQRNAKDMVGSSH
ncbi:MULTISPECIES: NapC/NirT family cytochrome c [Rodentibacter]|uniref:NapC/NirT family cytochrome c n=1 Tax=Rodentibacter TaxID=1960084 RepID=UPI001CFE453B|nr:NapC/NirT family cytochrome c [Rodentibacter sp. JRC1]GJI56395.1 cytochrome c-type protein TorY [Rodentibacter sp. JRC1]